MASVKSTAALPSRVLLFFLLWIGWNQYVSADTCPNGFFARSSSCDSLGRLSHPESSGHLYVGAEYLGWFVKSTEVPALVTGSPATTPPLDAGILGLPTTSVLFGGEINGGYRSGGRFVAGWWFDCGRKSGLELNYLGLVSSSLDSFFPGEGSEFLSRPFFDSQQGSESSTLVASPASNVGGLIYTQTGAIAVHSTSNLQSIELLHRRVCASSFRARTEILFGYRYGQLDSSINVFETSNLRIASAVTSLDAARIREDRFGASNDFNGIEMGFSQAFWKSRFGCKLRAKAAVGATSSRLTVSGITNYQNTYVNLASPASSFVTTATLPTGFLVAESNSGTIRRTTLGSMIELGSDLHYAISNQWSLKMGYTMLWWPGVVRAAEQIDTNLDLSKATPRPDSRFGASTLWAQGISFGSTYIF